MIRKLFSALAAAIAGTVVAAAEFHVAPNGADTNPGTVEQPFATLEKARDSIRGQGGDIVIHGGIYTLAQPLVLTPQDSGSPEKPVRYLAAKGEIPILCGTRIITGWQLLKDPVSGMSPKAAGKVWVADIPKGWRFHTLQVNGKRADAARQSDVDRRHWPKDIHFSKITRTLDPKDPIVVTFGNKKQLENLPANGDVEALVFFRQYLGVCNVKLMDINPQNGTAHWNSWTAKPRSNADIGYMLENAPAFLDRAGEWCVDSAAGKVYYWPLDGKLAEGRTEAPWLASLVQLKGTGLQNNDPKVRHVVFQGLTFRGTTSAAIDVANASDCRFSDNRILMVDGPGIRCAQSVQRLRIEGNEIGWPGEDGIVMNGGGSELDILCDNRIERNWIHHVGEGYNCSVAGISLQRCSRNRLACNLIEYSPYVGIRVSGVMSLPPPKDYLKLNPLIPENIKKEIEAGTFKWNRTTIKPFLHADDNVVERNIVVEPETKLDEGGAIYSWGPGKGNVWRENLVYKSSGFPASSILALDDVSEYYTVVDNVIWVNGRAGCGTVGVRPAERGNVIRGNIRAAFKPEHADKGNSNLNGIAKGFYKTDPTRDPVYRLLKTITEETTKAGGWPGNPKPGIPGPDESIKNVHERTLSKDAHMTIE